MKTCEKCKIEDDTVVTVFPVVDGQETATDLCPKCLQVQSAMTSAQPADSGSQRAQKSAITEEPRYSDEVMNDPIFIKVRDIITEQLGVSADQVKPDAKFVEDLGADSLDTVELVMAFEEEFDIEVPDEVAEKLQAVGDVIAFINNPQG